MATAAETKAAGTAPHLKDKSKKAASSKERVIWTDAEWAAVIKAGIPLVRENQGANLTTVLKEAQKVLPEDRRRTVNTAYVQFGRFVEGIRKHFGTNGTREIPAEPADHDPMEVVDGGEVKASDPLEMRAVRAPSQARLERMQASRPVVVEEPEDESDPGEMGAPDYEYLKQIDPTILMEALSWHISSRMQKMTDVFTEMGDMLHRVGLLGAKPIVTIDRDRNGPPRALRRAFPNLVGTETENGTH